MSVAEMLEEPAVQISPVQPGEGAGVIAVAPPNSTAEKPAAPRFQRVVLTGFMGAGKSTVGALLAKALGWRFVDVDTAIEAKAAMKVAEVFAKYGEFVFRRMETSAVAHALGERNCVIALGGGAPEVLANRLLLEQTPATAVVFLDAPLELLLARCDTQPNAAIRPNLQDRVAAEERFRYRMPLYRRCAKFRVATAGLSAEAVTAQLLQLVQAN